MAGEVKILTIAKSPYQRNPHMRVSFEIDALGWSILQKSEEWKSFLEILEECQTRGTPKRQKGYIDLWGDSV